MHPHEIELLVFNGRHLIKCRVKEIRMKDYFTVDELAIHFGVNRKDYLSPIVGQGDPGL